LALFIQSRFSILIVALPCEEKVVVKKKLLHLNLYRDRCKKSKFISCV
jgi:hypothetical protein